MRRKTTQMDLSEHFSHKRVAFHRRQRPGAIRVGVRPRRSQRMWRGVKLGHRVHSGSTLIWPWTCCYTEVPLPVLQRMMIRALSLPRMLRWVDSPRQRPIEGKARLQAHSESHTGRYIVPVTIFPKLLATTPTHPTTRAATVRSRAPSTGPSWKVLAGLPPAFR